MSPDGTVACRASRFDEDLLFVDLDLDAGDAWRPRPDPRGPTEPAEVYRAVVLGTRDYVRKNGFRRSSLGLSGGVDSALVAAIAADALGADAVRALAMPSMYSSPESWRTRETSPGGSGSGSTPCRSPACSRRTRRSPSTSGAVEGVARRTCRRGSGATTLMAVSNRFGPIVLATGNKSRVRRRATRRSTATWPAGSRRSRTSRRRSSTSSAHGGTPRRRGGRRAADPRAHDDEAALGRAPAGPARHRLAPAVRRARPDHRGLREDDLDVDGDRRAGGSASGRRRSASRG